MDSEQLRRGFESFVSAPPFEAHIARYPDNPVRWAWPGNYCDLGVGLAWEAYQAAYIAGLRRAAGICEHGKCLVDRFDCESAILAEADALETGR